MKFLGSPINNFECVTDFRHLSSLKGFSMVTWELEESVTVAWD